MMRRQTAFALAFALLVAVPAAAAGAWPLNQGNPTRSGATPDPLPETNDTAWRIELPAITPTFIVVEDTVLVGAHNLSYYCIDDAECEAIAARFRYFDGVIALDAATGAEKWRLPVPTGAVSVVFAGGVLFTEGWDQVVRAFDYATREPLWEAHALPEGEDSLTLCICVPPLLVADGLVVAGGGVPKVREVPHGPGDLTTFVAMYEVHYVGLDAATGEERWRFVPDRLAALPEANAYSGSFLVVPDGAGRFADRIIIQHFAFDFGPGRDPDGELPYAEPGADPFATTFTNAYHAYSAVFALTPDGALVWSDEHRVSGTATGRAGSNGAFGDDFSVFVQHMDGKLYGYNVQSGQPLFEPVDLSRFSGSNFTTVVPAYADQTVYSPSQTLYAVHGLTGELLWTVPPPAPREFFTLFTIAAGNRLAATTSDGYISTGETTRLTLHVLDRDDGTVLWSDATPSRGRGNLVLGPLIASGGRLFMLEGGGFVHAFGRGPATPDVPAKVSDLAPPPRGEVRVDFGKPAAPGGPITRYVVTWGDGSVDAGLGPTFTHRFNESGRYRLQAQAVTDGGASGSRVFTVDVGGPRLNALQRAFSDENLGNTLEIVALVGSLLVFLVGIVLVRRRKSTLRELLRRADALHERVHADPVGVQSALGPLRGDVQRALDGHRIDESHFLVLERRLDALRRTTRLAVMGDELDFLPHGLVRSLERALDDGAVSRYEWERFAADIAASGLPSDDRERALAVVRRWVNEDTGREPGAVRHT